VFVPGQHFQLSLAGGAISLRQCNVPRPGRLIPYSQTFGKA